MKILPLALVLLSACSDDAALLPDTGPDSAPPAGERWAVLVANSATTPGWACSMAACA